MDENADIRQASIKLEQEKPWIQNQWSSGNSFEHFKEWTLK